MTTPIDPMLEERLRDWLGEGPDVLPDRSVRAIMSAVAARPQLAPRWWHRLSAAAPTLAVGLGVAAAAALLAIVGTSFLDRDGGPTIGGPVADVIAYATDIDGSLDIWTVDLASGQGTQLTSGPESDTYPDWSPDGERLAFIRDGDLWVMDADGSQQVPIVVGDGIVEGVDWSPDGATVAYGYQREVGQSEIRLVSGDGSNDRLLLAVDAPFGCCPRWSPAGDELVIVIDLSESGGQSDLYLLSAAGGSPRRLTSTDGDDGSPAWSPVGDLIAFQSDAAFGLALIAPDGSGRRDFVRVSTQGFASAWSPTGDRIAWVDPAGFLMATDITEPISPHPVPLAGFPDRHSLTWRDN